MINLFVTLTAGYALSREDLRGRKPITLFFIFTMFFSGGTVPTYMLVKNLGLLNTFWAMVLPNAMSVWNLILCRNFFEGNIPKELLEVSKIDGCRNDYFFLKIVLPLSKALIAVMVLFYAVGHWNSYMQPLLYLSDRSRYPLQLVLKNILISSQPDASLAGMTGGTLQTDGNVEICVGSGIQRTDDRTLSFCTEVFRTRGYGRLCKRLK